MKPVDVNSSTYIDFSVKNIKTDFKYKVGEHVKISKLKSIFTKDCIPNWSDEAFVIKKVENTVPWTYAIGNLNPIHDGGQKGLHTSFSPVTSTNVRISPPKFLTSSFQAILRASPKLLIFNQDHPSKKAVFVVKYV